MKDEHQKLSKRNGDASYQDLVAKGYLPDAIINYLALLGWSPKGETEIFSMDELIKEFDIAGISKSPAIFDPEKLKHINAEYIRALSMPEYKARAMPFIKQAVKRGDIDFDVLCEALMPRTEYFGDIPERLTFIDELPQYDNALYEHKKMKTDPATAKAALELMLPVLEGVADWTLENIHAALFALIEKEGLKNGYMLWPLRVALSGVPVSPGGGIELAAILGKAEALKRIETGLGQL